MKYPTKRAAAMRTLTTPDLAGGVNTRDNITAIMDNQLNSAKNVYFKNGALRTRPGLKCFSEPPYSVVVTGPQKNKKQELNDTNTKVINSNIQVTLNEKTYKLSAIAFPLEDATPDKIVVRPFLTGETDTVKLAELYVAKTISRTVSNMRLFFAEHNGTLYLYNGEEKKVHVLNIDSANSWRTLREDEIYAPLVALGLSAFGEDSTKDKAPKGTLIDGYNLLGRYYQAEYTSVNTELLDPSNTSSTHKMRYYLLNSINGQPGFNVTVTYTASDGNVYTHSATIEPIYDEHDHVTSYKAEEDTLGNDGKRITVTDNVITFLSSAVGETDVVATVTASDLVRDNMTVTAPVQNGKEDKVFYNSFCEWFGGAAEGIAGGIRLFLGGNSRRDEQSAIAWSALNNPLYFPENNYVHVGESASAVTAFGKQGNNLIIFKERELWATRYVDNTLSAESIESQNTIDTQSAIAYFPLTLLSPQIGCNLPGTIQLCANRLVWANKGGKVYTLVNDNQYNEKNIYTVSEMIKEVLSSANLDNTAKSADYDGAYWLFIKDKVFVMDYESYGYRYISSYSKTEDAGVRIPWWIFEMPAVNVFDISVLETSLVVTMISKSTYERNVHHYLDFAKFDIKSSNDEVRTYTAGTPDEIENRDISTVLETKVFDFNTPQFNKNIHEVNLGLRANGGIPIRVSYMNESSERMDDDYITCSVNASDRSSRNVQNIQLKPGIRNCSRFGLRLECEGGMSINHISINYTITGGAK